MTQIKVRFFEGCTSTLSVYRQRQQDVADFVEDTSENAVERVVEKLLDSPHFGERWGRHWLDLVRYAESRGHEFDNDTPNAFQYRDYVIRALNADLPYDQFIREQIAGDLLEEPRLHPEEGFNESVLGTGFWFLGEWVHSPVDIRKDESDRFDNMIDVMSKTFLGVTVACARCHDHKFDAISTADYYSLSGFLQSSDYRQVRFESMEQNRLVAKRLAETDAEYQGQLLELLREGGTTAPEPRTPDQRVPDQSSLVTDEAIVVDYASSEQSDFMQDGFIFGESPRRAGVPYLMQYEVEQNQTDSPSTEDDQAAIEGDQAAIEGDQLASGEDRPSQTEFSVRIATFDSAANDLFWEGLSL